MRDFKLDIFYSRSDEIRLNVLWICEFIRPSTFNIRINYNANISNGHALLQNGQFDFYLKLRLSRCKIFSRLILLLTSTGKWLDRVQSNKAKQQIFFSKKLIFVEFHKITKMLIFLLFSPFEYKSWSRYWIPLLVRIPSISWDEVEKNVEYEESHF